MTVWHEPSLMETMQLLDSERKKITFLHGGMVHSHNENICAIYLNKNQSIKCKVKNDVVCYKGFLSCNSQYHVLC